MRNVRSLYFVIGSIFLVIVIAVGVLFLVPKKEGNVENNTISNTLSQDKIIEYFSLHNQLLMLGFPNYGSETTDYSLKKYDDQEERFQFLQAYFNDNDDIQDAISFHTFDEFSKLIFGRGLNYDLIDDYYKMDDDIIRLDTPTSWFTLFSFWKVEYDSSSDVYSIFIVDFAPYYDSSLVNKYSSFIKVSIDDLNLYHPSLLIVKVKKVDDSFQLVSSEYDNNYNY